MPNKPTTLREEFKKKYHLGNDSLTDEVADWWLSKFDSHSTELVSKIEGMKLKQEVDATENGYNIALDEVISLINQEKERRKLTSPPMKQKSDKKKFRFPKGIRQVNIPSYAPIGWGDIARQTINSAIDKYGKLPKNAMIRFEYRLTDYNGDGITEVQIYSLKQKHSDIVPPIQIK